MATNKYFSYLMRIWQDKDQPDGAWLASLEDPSTKRMLYFKSIEELFTFLHEKSHQDQQTIHQVKEE